MSKNRSKRLRKKLYVDEFAVLGFDFSCSLKIEKASDYDQLVDAFFDFIESRNLTMGGGADLHSFDGFVVAEGRYDSATEDDRKAIEKWLSDNPLCADVKVGNLIDANQDF